MRTMFRVRAASCVMAFALAGAAARAQMAGGQLWYVHQEVAKPWMLAEYDSTTKEVMSLGAKHKAPLLSQAVVLQGEDLTYTIAIPVKDANGNQAIAAEFGMIAEKEGPGFADVMRRGWAPVESVREFVLQEWPELSYRPEKPSYKPGETAFYHYDIYYVMPGHDEEALAIAKDFVALFKAKGIGEGYRTFTVVNGPEMPALIVEVPAKDGADYYARNAAAQATLGDAGRALFARAFAITRRLERKNAMLRPDLSPATWPRSK